MVSLFLLLSSVFLSPVQPSIVQSTTSDRSVSRNGMSGRTVSRGAMGTDNNSFAIDNSTQLYSSNLQTSNLHLRGLSDNNDITDYYISKPYHAIDNQIAILEYYISPTVERNMIEIDLFDDELCSNGSNNEITYTDYVFLDIEYGDIFYTYRHNGQRQVNVTVQMNSQTMTSSLYHEHFDGTPQVIFCVKFNIFDQNVALINVTNKNYKESIVTLDMNSPNQIIIQDMSVEDAQELKEALRPGVIEILLFVVFGVIACFYFFSRGGIQTTTKVARETIVATKLDKVGGGVASRASVFVSSR